MGVAPQIEGAKFSAVLAFVATCTIASVMAVGMLASAQDAPHSSARGLTCMTCHLNHDQFGNQVGSIAGNANACLSCHQVGGLASRQALADQQQAKLGPDAVGQPKPEGNSHRWDASPSGRVESLSGAPASAIETGGSYTGRYAASYTITITAAGDSGLARFNWTGLGPGAGSGTDILTGTNVTLETGLAVSFVNVRPSPAFAPGDQWRITARPGLGPPANPDMLNNMADGKVVCATCHEVHFQDAEPFDPAAPAYFSGDGQGRHFMRTANDTDQMCYECHASRFVTNALAGSHPVGVLVISNAVLRPPASVPLDKHEGRMWCSTCHQVHNSSSGDGKLLRTGSQQELCSQCHANVDATSPASHLDLASGPLWPGGQYGSLLPADTDSAHRGSCGNCHHTHGWPDAANASADYPSLLVEREENLCYTCHDGSPAAKNLVANFNKTYRHPVSYSGRHTATEDGNPASYGTANRHSECVDCHNAHQLLPDSVPPVPPAASSALRGVARVSVNNLSATSVSYTFRGKTDPTPVKEYELCFTCHSGWTTRPAGQADYALKFNTMIPSFHPVESLGKNTNININAFVNGWRPNQMMACTDCHSSDDTNIRGPHGSAFRYILKKSYVASPASRTMSGSELCFDCHRYDTYANNGATTTVKNYSRFGGGNGHAYHVGSRHYPCYTCHETHGAANLPNLLVTGRSPGINTYTRTAGGGSCAPSCHGSESYSVAYPR
jgi:predicted CXXCH cytochrome family protein